MYKPYSIAGAIYRSWLRNYNVYQFGVRAAMNAPVQGTAADLIKIAMVKAADAFSSANLDAKILLQVHDELILKWQRETERQLLFKAGNGRGFGTRCLCWQTLKSDLIGVKWSKRKRCSF